MEVISGFNFMDSKKVTWKLDIEMPCQSCKNLDTTEKIQPWFDLKDILQSLESALLSMQYQWYLAYFGGWKMGQMQKWHVIIWSNILYSNQKVKMVMAQERPTKEIFRNAQRKIFYFNSNFTEVCSWVPIDTD